MGHALRVLGFVVFVAALAGATYGAYQAFPPEETFSSVELSTTSEGPLRLLADTPTPLNLQARNLGDAPVTITLATGTEGATVALPNGPVTLDANQTRTLRGTMTVPAGTAGTLDVQVRALNNATGERVGVLKVPVQVVDPLPAELELVTPTEAVLAGETASFQVQVTNPAQAPQAFQLAVEGTNGTVQPSQLQVRANETGSAQVQVPVPAGAGSPYEVTVVATIATGQETRESAQFQVVSQGAFHVGAARDAFTVAPGNQFSVPLVIVSNQQSPNPVQVEAEHLVGSTFTNVSRQANAGGFVTLEAPADLTELTETITVTVGNTTQQVTVEITPPEDEAQQATISDRALANYIGRLPNGEIFDTSLPEIMQGPYPKHETFRARPNPEPLTAALSPSAGQLIEGFRAALEGMHVGETKTVTLSPSEAYGPGRTHVNLSATTEVPRTEEVARFLRDLPIQQLPPAFEIETKEEGDVLTFNTTSGDQTLTFRFRLVEKGEETVTLERLEQVGDRTTFYPIWPNATEVVDVTEESILFRTTPPEETGNFTWQRQTQPHVSAWEDATTIANVNETTIVLRHHPTEGMTYQASSQPGAPPQTWTVEAVGEEVHVSAPSQNPLAGQALTFDIYLVGLQPASQAPTS